MTASRNKARRRIRAAAFEAALWAAGIGALLSADRAAAAGPGADLSDGPQTLTPGPGGAPPAPREGPADGAAPMSGREAPAAGVTSAALDRLDPDSAGVWPEADGGFPDTLWAGARRGFVDRLLARIDQPEASPTLFALARRLLLTAATAPEGDAGPAPPGAVPLYVRRLDALAALGDAAGTRDLAGLFLGQGDPAVWARDLDAAYATFTLARACATAEAGIRHSPETAQDPRLQKSFVFCQIVAGETDKASTGLSALIDTGYRPQEDPLYFALTDLLLHGVTPKSLTFAGARPLHAAMARQAKAALDETVLEADGPLVWRAVAENDNAALDLRIAAAEKAVAMNALRPEALADLYRAVGFTPEEVANAVSGDETGPRGRALLYRAALDQAVPTARAEALKRGLERAREDGQYGLVARMGAGPAGDISPSPALAWFAPEAIRLFLFVGETDAALAWEQALADAAAEKPEAAADLLRLYPVLQLSDRDQVRMWSDAALGAWWEDRRDLPGARAGAAAVYPLLTAAGKPVDSEAWLDLIGREESAGAPVRPDTALWSALRTATDGLKLGEVVLLSLAGLSGGALEDADPLFVADVVTGLRVVGLHREAHALAVETAILRGL